jgi:hypothetical protein
LDEEIDAFQARIQAMAAAKYQRPPTILRLQSTLRRHRTSGFVNIEPRALAAEAMALINSRLAPAHRVSSILDRLLEQAGADSGQTSYPYVLIYDVVDSTGKKAFERGADVAAYRRSVASWKTDINVRLREHAKDVRRRGGAVTFCRGDLDSTDDEKHVFLGGPHALAELKATLGLVLETCFAYPDIHLRIQVAPCNFSGGGAYRGPTDTEVHGTAFWEHMSRLRPQIKQAYEPRRGERSTLSVVTSGLRQTFSLPAQVHSSDIVDEEFDTQIAGLHLPTRVTTMAVEIRLGDSHQVPVVEDEPRLPPRQALPPDGASGFRES